MAQTGEASMSGGRARWRAYNPLQRLLKLAGLALLTGLLLLGALSLFENQYGSEARLQLEATGDGVGPLTLQFAAPLIASQIEVLRSQELAAKVAERNDLLRDPEFNQTLDRLSPIQNLAVAMGLIPDPYFVPIREQVVRNFRAKLSVFRVPDTHLISISFRAKEPDKAARLINDLAAIYIEWLGTPGKVAPSGNIATLNARIAGLRETIRDNDTKLARMIAEQKIAASNEAPVVLPDQIGELQGELFLARAKRMETEKRAALIREMLQKQGDLQRTSELFQTDLIQRLLDQRVRLQRKIADLSAILLPSHPQMKRLMSELADLRLEIRSEAKKVAAALDNDIEIARAREQSLQASLSSLNRNPEPVKNNTAAIEAVRKALAEERRELAESEARLDTINVLSDTERPHLRASLIAPATADHVPVFPKKGPIVLFGMTMVFLIGLVYLLIKAMLGWPRVERRKGERRLAPRPPAVDEVAPVKNVPAARVEPQLAPEREKPGSAAVADKPATIPADVKIA